MTLNCNATETDTDWCDGRAEIVKKNFGSSRSGVDSRCNKDPGANCFAKVLLTDILALLVIDVYRDQKW